MRPDDSGPCPGAGGSATLTVSFQDNAMRPRSIPPVHLFAAAAFAVGAAVAFPATSFKGVFFVWAGVAAFGMGFWLMMCTYRVMKARATTHQFDATTRLIEDDVFRYSRNPMYLGMTVMLLGVALALRNFAALIAPIYFFTVIDRIFVPFEEKKLEREVGQPYLLYKRKVRRWL